MRPSSPPSWRHHSERQNDTLYRKRRPLPPPPPRWKCACAMTTIAAAAAGMLSSISAFTLRPTIILTTPMRTRLPLRTPLEMVSTPTATGGTGSTADSDDIETNEEIYKMFMSRPNIQSGRSDLRVPSWLPWLPTRSQVERLKVHELKEACEERGLPKTGRKAELQSRLISWTADQHMNRIENRRMKLKGPDHYYQSMRSSGTKQPQQKKDTLKKLKKDQPPKETQTPLSIVPLPSETNLDTYDDEEEDDNDATTTSSTTPFNSDYIDYLTRTFKTNTTYSNLQVRELYSSAKRADQAGDKQASRQILRQLLDATPSDARIISRLARLATEEGDINEARRLLQGGCRTHPSNAHFRHSLALLELDAGCPERARKNFKEAIVADPRLPHPYHAWGRFEHACGNIRLAMTLFKKGLRFVPDSHRLYHALGGLYREAGMLREAESAFKKGMDCGPRWSQSFFYTSLAYVGYDKDGADGARVWLWKGVRLNKKHAQGWLALAQLEESEGNFGVARDVYLEAVEGYEKSRGIDFSAEGGLSPKRSIVIPKRTGDMWTPVYNSWARMEESQGNIAMTNDVYARATKVFPTDWKILTNWAQFLSRSGHQFGDKARIMFKKACRMAGTGYSEPYRLHAEYEISQQNYEHARTILYLGALLGTNNPKGRDKGLASLFHTWAKLESKHFDNPTRAEVLYDHTLRLTEVSDENRAMYLSSLAKFEFSRGNYRLAQHAIILSINDDYGRDVAGNWHLWSDIATALGDEHLAEQCHNQALKVNSLLFPGGDMDGVRMMKDPKFREMLCKAPWHRKLFKNGIEHQLSYR